MHTILITNDDGITADGMYRLAKEAMQFGKVFIVAPDTTQGIVECALTFLALGSSLKVLGAVAIATSTKIGLFGSYSIIIVRLFAFQGGVIVHFCVDTVNQLRHW